jgi:hypothetical protein
MEQAEQVRAWAWWPLRVVALIQAVVMFDQAVFAGQFLSGEFGALARHGENATNAGIATVVMFLAAVVLRWPGGGPTWPILACTGLFGLIALQIAIGYARLLTLHVPLGVALIMTSTFVLVRVWRPVLTRSSIVRDPA